MNILTDSAKVIVFIADIHFGATESATLLKELQDIFIDKLDKLSILDLIVIGGDFYDTKLSMNSAHAKISFEFMKRLIRICSNKGAKLRIVKGTESHDNKQLELFEIIGKVDIDIDIRVITSVMEEKIFNCMNVLYLPEEYIVNTNEYYKDYFNNKYDMIFGHGLFKETAFTATHQSSELTHSKAPIYDSGEMLNICKGPIFFGHIHTQRTIKDRIFYSGSFSRWCYGEEDPKGYYICIYSPINNTFKVEFIKNTLAPIYKTMTVDFNSNEPSIIEGNFSFINDMIESNDTRLRIILNIRENIEIYKSFLLVLNDKLIKYPNIKLIINNNNKIKQKEEVDKKINILMSRYGFVFDKNITYEEKIHRYIKERYVRHIDMDKIRYYLFEKFLK